LQGILLHYFIQKKSAAEAHRILVETYGNHALSETICRDWFTRFRNNDFDIKDKERSGGPKKFEGEESEALLHEDLVQTLADFVESLEIDHTTVSKYLKVSGMIQKQEHCVPHELKPRDVERRLFTCEQLLQRQERKGFLHRIVTSDEKWIYYDNPKPDHTSTWSPKSNTHDSKLLLCIWWDQMGVIYYELLKPNEIITGDHYRLQLMRLSRALKKKLLFCYSSRDTTK